MPVARMRQAKQWPRLSSPNFYFLSLKILRNFGISDILARPPGLASFDFRPWLRAWARILVQVTIYRRLLIGRDGHLDQSEAYDIS